MEQSPDEKITRVKREIKIIPQAHGYGIETKGQGKNQMARCPWHLDTEGSLSFSNDLFHCFGCGAAGSVIDLVMKMEGKEFLAAVEQLAAQLPMAGGNQGNGQQLTASAPMEISAVEAREWTGKYHDFCHRTLLANEVGKGYLKKRGIFSQALIERARLGQATRTFCFTLPKGKAGLALRRRYQECGILRESGHEHMSGSITVPFFDRDGHIVQIYGRKVLDNLRTGTPKHLYLARPLAGIFNRDGIRDKRAVILTEAPIDALTYLYWDFSAVTCAFGVNGFTNELLDELQRNRTEFILNSFDADDAGDRGADQIAERLVAAGIGTFRIKFPRGEDANAFALKHDRDGLAELIRQAEWMGAGSRPELDLLALCTPAEVIDVAATPAPKEETSSAKGITLSPAQVAADNAPARVANIEVARRGDAIIMRFGDRCYRVYNFEQNNSHGSLKINLLVARGDEFHMDTLDFALYNDRKKFWERSAVELNIKEDIIKRDIGKVLFKLEELQDELIKQTLAPQEQEITMTEDEREEAMRLLLSADLMGEIRQAYYQSGIVGEEINCAVCYLVATSRLLDDPLSGIIQSSSASGKTTIMDRTLDLMPPEAVVKYTAMTSQSLYYLGEKNLKHKILALGEQAGGGEKISYPLKMLQSEGELTIASTGKDPQTGRHRAHDYKTEGPSAFLSTSTAIDLDEELLNRNLVMASNESREQTRAIHELQRERETIAGLFARETRERVQRIHRNAQRLLRAIAIVNPYGKKLTFLNDKMRTRRDHVKYLKLIRTVTLLHQYQREVKTGTQAGTSKQYIEVTPADIEIANLLANEVMGRCLDELPPQSRRFLQLLTELVAEKCEQQQIEQADYRFWQRDAREYTGWSDFQVKTHLRKLVEMEYLVVHRGGRGQQFVYELLYRGEGQDGSKFVMGLIDVEKLREDEK